MEYAVLFPGQGSQAVGMGADVCIARPDLIGEAGEILGWELGELCLGGPEQELTRTDRAQAALFVVSYALWEAFSAAAGRPPAAAAGHSLGEYTALAAAGVFGFRAGLRLVATRGEAMARAAGLEASGMAALLGADPQRAESLCAARRGEGGRLWVANLNAPGQVVAAGGEADLEWAAANARAYGIRRVIRLKVAGAFHSPFMAPAAADLAAALAGVESAPPAFPVWSNHSAAPHGADVGGALVAQLTGTVRFEESLRAMAAAGITRFVHIGPGDVTAGLVRKSIEHGETAVVSTLEEAAAAAAGIGDAA
jgi:[acyl-carrier-protein] S-malonyltransferase